MPVCFLWRWWTFASSTPTFPYYLPIACPWCIVIILPLYYCVVVGGRARGRMEGERRRRGTDGQEAEAGLVPCLKREPDIVSSLSLLSLSICSIVVPFPMGRGEEETFFPSLISPYIFYYTYKIYYSSI